MSNPIEILCDLLKESGLKMRFPKNADSATIGKAIDLLADRQREQQGALAAKDAEIAALKAKLAAWDKAAIEVGYCHEAEGHNPVAVGPKTMAESVLMERDQKEPLYEEISDLRDKLEEAERKLRELTHEVWHFLDDSEVRENGDIVVCGQRFVYLAAMVPEEHPSATLGAEQEKEKQDG